MTDKTRVGKNAEKKTLSVSSANLLHGDVDAVLQELFVLPPDCLITDTHVIPKVAGLPALLTVDIGFDGGSELGSALDVDDTAVKGGALATAVDTGTGQTVTALFSADPTAGDFDIIVEYIEYTLGNGKLTNYA